MHSRGFRVVLTLARDLAFTIGALAPAFVLALALALTLGSLVLGILALALEVASEKSSLTLTTELDCSGAGGLSPKFAATLNLSP